MRVFIFENGIWREYDKGLLWYDQSYKFVAWTMQKVVLVAPTEVDGLEFLHYDAVRSAIESHVVPAVWENPNAVGVICGNSSQGCDKRIVLWTSIGYGITTPEELRPQIREALDLEDFVFSA